MKVFKYGVMLERLKEDDIELVRQWRNSDQVRLNMVCKDVISADQQLNWYKSINNPENNYMLIHCKGEKIGVVNDKNINWKERSSETGIFIGRPEYLYTCTPFFISVAGVEINFHYFKWQKQYAHILKSNTNAIKYNLQLGYNLEPGQEDKEIQLYTLNLNDFESKACKIIKAVRAIAPNDAKARILLEPLDYETGWADYLEPNLLNNPFLEVSKNHEGTWFKEL